MQVRAQSEQEILAQREQARAAERQRLIMMTLDSAVALMQNEEYTLADVKFRKVLSQSKSVTSDLTFYFGQNSYHLGLHRQAIDWLNKYIQLKGTTGQFSEEAVAYLKKSEAAFITVKKQESKDASEVLSKNFDIDCGPTGKVICPVCNGSTVVIKKTYFGESYKTCQYCNKLGYLLCDDYNKLLRGQLNPTSN